MQSKQDGPLVTQQQKSPLLTVEVCLAPVEVVQPAVPQQGVEAEAVVAAQNLMPAVPLAPEQPQQPQQAPQQPTAPPIQQEEQEEHNNHTILVPNEQQAPEPMTIGQELVLPTPPEQQQQGPRPVATQHGFEWFDAPEGIVIGNPIRQRKWVLKTPVNDEEICDGCDIGFSRSSSRATLWSTVASFKYIPAPAFGRTGMPHNRFDSIWECLTFSRQPEQRPEGMSAEAYRWLLIDDFINEFNEYQAANFIPGSTICVDELIARWYGMGGHWINEGIPNYVAIDRKPENG
ncbi:unnamed protein product [Cylindrotheca closterium]|uniref:PiggyBac transposable element-derived protein domain-containing protein n=1 Tax=Cylindrotheca closterium TaxID=2856 RepID=A0AAD2JM04_9STRA|nr:unnamed protein product [Cylindrotheca closterium]